MNSGGRLMGGLGLLATFWLGGASAGAGTFRVATYNLENYIEDSTGPRPAKSAEAKAVIRQSICALRPDVLALQEVGSPGALTELRDSLKSDGLDLPYWEFVSGFDTNVHLAVLSRFPFTARRPHTNDQFLVSGRRFRVSRGFAEVDIAVNSNYAFTLLAAHLKSKRPVPAEDEADLRLEEAKLLRENIEIRFAANADANLVVLGDLNDAPDAPATKTVLGRGRRKLVDTRPAERNSALPPGLGPSATPRAVAWTHHYAREDSYARIDYILLSPGMAREWITSETYLLAAPNWGVASDHRPLVAEFEAEDK
jgi:endonuclease/exonuclease/phosphatase family metal-dependent hydrolase